ncbi:MAG: hypothetical protein P4L82_11910 [Ancalomicrobiaceae bacterium]|nr:hypothetical protein [Ancalomicrobiaceae bacterium]
METVRLKTRLKAATQSLFTGGGIYDLISLADVKEELDLTDKRDDAWLRKQIRRKSKLISRACNDRVFVPELWQETIYPGHDAYVFQLPPRMGVIALAQRPLACAPPLSTVAPPLMPQLVAVSGGSLPTRRYHVRVSYVAPDGETALSLEATLPIAAGKLLSVSAPKSDSYGLATGWNVYAGATSYGETLQASLSLATGWTEPTTGLIAGGAMPNTITVVENAALAPVPLAEGIDFTVVDADRAEIVRLYGQSGEPKPWGLPFTIVYSAGFNPIPEDLVDAAIRLVKTAYMGRPRDPMVRRFSLPGVYEEERWLGTGPGGIGDLPVDIAETIGRYRDVTVA